MERIEFTGKTIDQAVMNAMNHFNTTRDKINVRIVEEGSKGFFGIGVKDAKIVAYLKDSSIEAPLNQNENTKKETKTKTVTKTKAKAIVNEKSDSIKNDEKPVSNQEKRVVSSEVLEYSTKAAKDFVDGVIAKMDLDVTASVVSCEDHVKVTLSGDNVGTLIGRRGDTLDALQYLTNLTINKNRHGDDYCRVTVDTENYRAKREETLVRLAKSIASKAVKYHRDMSLEPMNPYERRIIHSTLQDHPYVKTKSVGEEPNRRIIVSLKK